jgi:hypothetical protein
MPSSEGTKANARMANHSSMHEALAVEEVSKHSSSGLEYSVVRLQKGKTDIRLTLHARPTFSLCRAT